MDLIEVMEEVEKTLGLEEAVDSAEALIERRGVEEEAFKEKTGINLLILFLLFLYLIIV